MPARTHGESKTRLYNEWQNMKARCYRKSTKQFYNYGGRGIVVCDEWKNSYEKFRDWALANGYNNNLTLDRINVDGNYEPDNCRWITNKDQQNNRRDNRLLTCDGETKTMAEWSEITGIKTRVISNRIDRNGWSVEEAIKLPIYSERGLMIGKRFNKLVGIKEVELNKFGQKQCLFRCDCGNEIVAASMLVRNGIIKSCGCDHELHKDIEDYRLAKAKTIQQIDANMNIIAEYRGCGDAFRKTGINRSGIDFVLRGKRKTAGGYYWRWKDDA